MKLYELAAQYNALQDAAASDDVGAFEIALVDLEGEFDDKVVATAKVVRELEAEAKAYLAESSRLAAHAEARTNAAKTLKGYIHSQMDIAGVDHVKGDVIDLKIQDGPPVIMVVDVYKVAASWRRATLNLPVADLPEGLRKWATFEVDKKAIAGWIKEGNAVPDGVTQVRGKHLRIR